MKEKCSAGDCALHFEGYSASDTVVKLIGNKLVKVNTFRDQWLSNGKEPEVSVASRLEPLDPDDAADQLLVLTTDAMVPRSSCLVKRKAEARVSHHSVK